MPPSLFSPVSALLREIEEAIAGLYLDNKVAGVRPRFSMALVALANHGPLTIRDLASFSGVTHAAMSQSVKAMKAAGLVHTEAGQDARSVVVHLSDKGRSVVPFLEAEWKATEAMLAELESELPYPLTKAVADVRKQLAKEPLRERLARQMRGIDSE
ncbi:MarR family transcriptional regulator [Sinirhodobacter populi]|uniref:MarR family transcriptional regulator n=2 Tax=Paenirhodobacter populi TaxID=2306993 RepID=A0A443JYK9_9RHOB|nr:MarR family transcriptional regulator [Sinirhodobacter populi]